MIDEDQPVSIRKGEELDIQSLNKYLGQNSSVGKIADQHQFPGGYSILPIYFEPKPVNMF